MLAPVRALQDAKTALQEWAQARGLPPPHYREIARSGPEHAPQFVIRVEIQGFDPMEASGGSKRMAEQLVAHNVLVREGVIAPDQPVSGETPL
jgi:ribonuclease-3